MGVFTGIAVGTFYITLELILFMMSESTFCASAPFSHPKADVFLRSSDGVYFRVFKLFLSLASEVFETLFDLPQPEDMESSDQERREGLPVIVLSEDAKTLDALLRFCYPCTLAEDPALDSFKDVAPVLEAAQKYALDSIEKTICKSIFNPKILGVDSLRSYAIGCRARLREECILAAKFSLKEPLVPAWFEEIELMTASDLLTLMTYHHRCGNAVQALKTDLAWITTHYQRWTAAPWMFGRSQRHGDWRDCCPRSVSNRYQILGMNAAQWWEDFMDTTFQALKERPCAETIRSNVETAVQNVRQRNCTQCSPIVAAGMQEFATLFVNKAEELISKIDLELKF